MKVIQVSSLFYGAIIDDNDKITIVSIGYPTYEMCMSALRIYEI